MAKKKSEETEEKKITLESLTDKMNKLYGKGTVIGGGERNSNLGVISTGSILFDKATNCGGIPLGKLIELYGMESSGKSTIALHIISEFQKAGKKCLLCDFEYSFDGAYATQIGVNIDDLIIAQPNTMEDGYNLIYEYVKSGLVSLIVIDSHTSMVSKMRLEGEIGDAKMAPEARVNSEALKKIKPLLEPNSCTLLGISQLRDAIGSMGEVKQPTGGNSWKFYPDMRIKIYKILDRPNELNKTVIEIVKNKCSKPYGKCEVPIAWGVGIDKMGELVSAAVQTNVIKQSGSWFSYGDSKLGQGAEAVKTLLADYENGLYAEIKPLVLEKLNTIQEPIKEEV